MRETAVSDNTQLAAGLDRFAAASFPSRPGPQPWNRIAASAEQQLARARRAPAAPEQLARARRRAEIRDLVSECLAAELPEALRVLQPHQKNTSEVYNGPT